MVEIKLTNYSIFLDSVEVALTRLLKEFQPSSVFVITDENVKSHCLSKFDSFDFVGEIVVTPGEKNKNLETCQWIWQKMMEAQLDRKSLVLNIGGGVIGDMGGFCASTYKRGIRFIQIPTTVLSSVDASVGGKLGVDFYGLKNNIGLFRDPEAVIIDTSFLKTLPSREIRSGFAEVIKHCLIRSKEQWQDLLSFPSIQDINWEEIIAQNVRIKKNIVEEDPFEKGVRKALNFGHTIGHAIETNALKSDVSLLHGEAVAIGMICESYLSYLKMGLAKSQLEEITRFILKVFGKTDLSSFRFDQLLKDMYQDKKNEDGLINCTLLSEIGGFMINQYPLVDEIEKSLLYYNTLEVE